MKTFWLDLEETVIKSWDEPFLINIQKIKDLIVQTECQNFGIFSFAIWDDNDKKFALTHFVPMIEDTFGIKISEIPTKIELFKSIKMSKNKQFDFDDFNDFWNKENAFVDWIRATHTGTHILIDDMVEDCEMCFHGCNIKMIKI